MEKSEEYEIDLINLRNDLEQKKNYDLKTSDMKEMFSELGKDSDTDGVVNDLFFNSVKMFYELGFQLANSLSFELLLDSEKEKDK